MTQTRAKSHEKRRRFSFAGIALSMAILVSAIGAAAGQYLLNEDVVAEFLHSRPLLPLDPGLWSITPGILLLFASGIVFALASRRLLFKGRAAREETQPAEVPPPEIEEGSAGRHPPGLWLVIEIVAVIAGLGLVAYLAGNLLAGRYGTELPLVELGCVVAFLVALICLEVRSGTGKTARSLDIERSGSPLPNPLPLEQERGDESSTGIAVLASDGVGRESSGSLAESEAEGLGEAIAPPAEFSRKWFPLRPKRVIEAADLLKEAHDYTPSLIAEHVGEVAISPREESVTGLPLPSTFPEKVERVIVRVPGGQPASVFGAILRPRTLAETAYVVLMSALFVYLNIRDLTNAAYAALGDEYSFFNIARDIAMGAPANLFSQRGVYGYHPVLDSAYQALVMNHFGINQFGWKLSGVLIVALSLYPLYLFARHLFGVLTALVATAIAGSSHYLLAYAHTGYNNINSIFPTVLSICAAGIGFKRKSPALLFLAGAFAGLGFYTFFSARFAIVALLLALFVEGVVTGNRLTTFKLLFFSATGFALATFPIFAVDRMDVITAMVSNSVAQGNANWLALVEEVSKRSLQSLLGFSFNPSALHYVSGSLFDPFSAALGALGIVVAVLRLNDWRFRFLLVWLIVGLAIAGGFYQGFNIATTRLMILVPILATFAAVVAGEFVRFLTMRFRRPAWRFTMQAIIVILLLAVIFTANLQRFWFITPARLPLRPETLAVEAVLSKRIDHANLAAAVVVAPAPDALARPVFESFEMGSQNPVLLNGDEKTFVDRYADSPLIVLMETSDADEKAIFGRYKIKAPEATFAEQWDASHKTRVGIINNPKPAPSATLIQAGLPAGLRAVMRLGGLGRSEGRFDSPKDVTSDRSGNLYVVDAGNHRIQKFDAGGNFLTAYGGPSGSDAYLKAPVSVAVDSIGQIAVLEGGDTGIKTYAADGPYLGTLGSDLGLSLPRSIIIDFGGNVYVADAGRVIKLSSDGKIVSSTTGGVGGAQFKEISGLSVDATGRLFILDGATGVVTKLDSQGRVETRWDTPARSGESQPKIAVNPDGSILVTAPNNRAILKFGSGGQSQGSFSGKTIIGQPFEVLSGLTVDGKGFVYIVDFKKNELSRLAFY